MSNATNILDREEELLPELQRYIVVNDKFAMINHPLVQAPMYTPGLNALYNGQLRARQEFIKKSLKNRNWSGFVFRHERPFRMDAFANIMDNLSDSEYWSLLGSIWVDSENIWQYGDLVPTLINSERPNREQIMGPDDRALYDTLPDEVVVYRGFQAKNRKGWSWTLSYWHAHWFAKRYGETHKGILRGKVNKSDIIAAFIHRHELECVVDYDKVKNPRAFNSFTWEHPYFYSLGLEGSVGLAAAAPVTYHGPWHWLKVDWNVQQLCKVVPNADQNVCRAFAYIHDCKRRGEDVDIQYGPAAAEYVDRIRNKLGFTRPQIEKLQLACRDHEKGELATDPTIAVCWDADRLDISRVGKIIDPKYLSTPAAKELIWRV